MTGRRVSYVGIVLRDGLSANEDYGCGLQGSSSGGAVGLCCGITVTRSYIPHLNRVTNQLWSGP